MLIDHADEWKEGVRVLILVSRKKDGATDRPTITRVSESPAQFDKVLKELEAIAAPYERIYSSASPRDMAKAVRKFKQRQLDADYSADPFDFYRRIGTRWNSCLMAIDAQVKAGKIWLFDCDEAGEFDMVHNELMRVYDRPEPPYSYDTKSGTHILVQPFNRSLLSDQARGLLQTNPMMLWQY